MDINTSTLVNTSTTYTPVRASGSLGATDVKPATRPESVPEESKQQNTKDQEMSKGDIKKTTADLNKIMQLVNADLQFEIHEKTQRIMVRLVDTKSDKVLKEFPPHELLDTIAAIREYIGVLLDKKA